MIKSKLFWHINKAACIAAWLFALGGTFLPIQNATIKVICWIVLLAFVVIHLLELKISMPIGKAAGRSLLETVIKTFIFGYTLWVPEEDGRI